MKCRQIASRPLVAVVLLGVFVSLGFGPASTAVQKVRQGLRHFANGEYEAARQAFTEADVAEPENLAITYDRACALAAAGDVEQARDLFQQAALARETGLAVRSHYNLGCLSAAQGRATLGDDPVAAAPEQRQQGLSLLLAAVGHYRDGLRLDAEHADARHNLELIRLFVKHIQAQWEQHDRQQAREEMGLLEFLAMIEQRQAALRSTVRVLNDHPDSPQRRQRTSETREAQAELKEEIEPLQEKIAAELQAAEQTRAGNLVPAQEPPDSSQSEQAQRLLKQLADEAGRLMTEAADYVESVEFADAERKQRDVLDRLNQIFMAVAPFSSVLQRATQQQQQLTTTSEAITGERESKENGDGLDDARPADERQDGNESTDAVAADADFPELQWQQSHVTDGSRMLSLKAESELPRVEAELQAASATGRQPEADPAHSDDDPTNPQTASGDPSAQLEALQASLQKAIELGPRIVDHSASAADSLGAADMADALPDQQQALKLLQEIAEPLAQQNQPQDNQQAGDGSNQEQNQQPEQQQQQPDQQNQQQPSGQSPQERAMSVLRRARERERQHRDLQKQLQQMIDGRVRVDRDW